MKNRLKYQLLFSAMCLTPIFITMEQRNQFELREYGRPWILWEHAPLQIALNVLIMTLTSYFLAVIEEGAVPSIPRRNNVGQAFPSYFLTILLAPVCAVGFFGISMFVPTSNDPAQGSALALFFLAPQFLGFNFVSLTLFWLIIWCGLRVKKKRAQMSDGNPLT